MASPSLKIAVVERASPSVTLKRIIDAECEKYKAGEKSATKLQITNQELAARKQEMPTAIQSFSSLKNRASIVKEQLKHCTNFWANLWLHVFNSL